MLAAACHGPDEAFVYESEDVTIRAYDSLCAGDVAFVKRTLHRIETDLDAPGAGPIEIEIVNQLPVPGCTSGAVGCSHDEGITTIWEFVDHELVHQVVSRRSETLPSFWSEGLAEAFKGARTQRGDASVSESIPLEPGDLDYNTAGHFVRWLWETRGVEAMRRVASGEPFEDVYGIDVDEAATLYEADAPWSFPPRSPCDYPPLVRDESGVANVEVDCEADDSTAFGFWYGIGAPRRLDLAAAGTYELRVEGGGGVSICACQTDVLDERPEDKYVGDVISETAGLKVPTPFESGVVHTVELEAGSYRVLPMLEEDKERGTVRVEIGRVSM